MASVYRDNRRNGYRAQVVVRGTRRKLWLGAVSKTQARAIANHLDRLKIAAETATTPPADTLRWSAAVSPRIRAQLGKWGLLAAGPQLANVPRTLGDYLNFYIANRGDTKTTTKARWSNVRRHLLDAWPHESVLTSITPGDCDRLAKRIRGRFRPSHAGKLLADAKQVFTAAVRDGAIVANPFSGLDFKQPHDTARESYIPPEIADRILAAADPFYAALFAMARYGGLRVPSEPLAMLITSIDWQNNRFTVPEVKTAARVVPIFPELRPHLLRLCESQPAGSVYLFDRARNAAATQWRKSLGLLLERLHIPPWPKRWQNLRASCRTDLEARFPGFVVDTWLGHSAAVGRRHYTRVHEAHFNAACGVTGGVRDPIATDTHR